MLFLFLKVTLGKYVKLVANCHFKIIKQNKGHCCHIPSTLIIATSTMTFYNYKTKRNLILNPSRCSKNKSGFTHTIFIKKN